jgi:hypothetical protein
MSNFEQYRVGNTQTISSTRFKLRSLTPIGTFPTPVGSILLVKGATDSTNRKGQEEGDGTATIYLKDSDYLHAVDHIDATDIVNYQSTAIANTNKASITNFNFPESE